MTFWIRRFHHSCVCQSLLAVLGQRVRGTALAGKIERREVKNPTIALTVATAGFCYKYVALPADLSQIVGSAGSVCDPFCRLSY